MSASTNPPIPTPSVLSKRRSTDQDPSGEAVLCHSYRSMMPMERGIPPDTVHRTPVPAHVMHSRMRRLTPSSGLEAMPNLLRSHRCFRASRSRVEEELFRKTFRWPIISIMLNWRIFPIFVYFPARSFFWKPRKIADIGLLRRN